MLYPLARVEPIGTMAREAMVSITMVAGVRTCDGVRQCANPFVWTGQTSTDRTIYDDKAFHQPTGNVARWRRPCLFRMFLFRQHSGEDAETFCLLAQRIAGRQHGAGPDISAIFRRFFATLTFQPIGRSSTFASARRWHPCGENRLTWTS